MCISTIYIAEAIKGTEEVQLQPRIYPSYILGDTYTAATSNQELPTSVVPFNVPEPTDELRPPQENSPVSFLDVPVQPPTDLTAPSSNPWNPENNPIFFYELPASLTRLANPTRTFPKKFNKEIHSKDKPLSSNPKIEIELVPVELRELVEKQKDLNKKLDHLAKIENQKDLSELKVREIDLVVV